MFVEMYTGQEYELVWLTMSGHSTLLRRSQDLIWAVPSPDGKKIAFRDNTARNRNIWVGGAGSEALR